jgi:hypothetical protein
LAAWGKHTTNFREEFSPFSQMLDHFEHDHQVERAGPERKSRARTLDEAKVRQGVVSAGVFDCLCRDVNADDRGCGPRQFRSAIARTAAGIQYVFPKG